MVTKGAFRFLLLPTGFETAGNELPSNLIYIPFWRYKGGFFRVLEDFSIQWSNFDSTICAIPELMENLNLGIRHQTMTMRLLDDMQKMPSPQISFHEGLVNAQKRFGTFLAQPQLERFIGAHQSAIYAPFAIKNRANKHLLEPLIQGMAALSVSDNLLQALLAPVDRSGATALVPLLCPECGADMPAQNRVIALMCDRCQKAWHIRKRRFSPLSYRIVAPSGADFNAKSVGIWLPFWVTEVKLNGLGLDNRAAFNLAAISYWPVNKDWHEKNICLVTPAFNLSPKMLLKLSAKMTIARISYDSSEIKLDCGARLAPVTLPYDVSAKMFKFILAELFQRHKKIAPLVHDSGIKAINTTLCYLPYKQNGNDLICQHTGNAISAQAVEIGMRIISP